MHYNTILVNLISMTLIYLFLVFVMLHFSQIFSFFINTNKGLLYL